MKVIHRIMAMIATIIGIMQLIDGKNMEANSCFLLAIINGQLEDRYK